MFGTQETLPGRRIRPVTAPRPVPQVCSKTKHALCFLCLFDGLRTPSIRRLVRKPRTVCQKPLLTFDPSFFAPSSEKALQQLYRNTLGVPSTTTVDPSIQKVGQLVKAQGKTSSVPQRLLVHYYGHGCHAPADGTLYFFSDDRSKYKPLKIQNLTKDCNCPLCFIFDCPCAAILKPSLKAGTFAFFACLADEGLPLSTDTPMDLFSSCLLNPYDTAVWWHMQRHSSVFDAPREPPEETKEFLPDFLNAILDAICFESQDSKDYEAFTLDPTVAALFRGFALAQRVMLSFNIHSQSLPDLKPMAEHSLWSIWDIAIDLCVSLGQDVSTEMLYNQCMETFAAFPSAGVFPLYTHFMMIPKFKARTSAQLLKIIDGNEQMAEIAARSGLAQAIAVIEKPTETILLLLAKMQTSDHGVDMSAQGPMAFTMSKKTEVLKCGMLNVCLAMTKNVSTAYGKMTRVCMEHTADCAPFSGLLLGLLLNGGRMFGLHGYTTEFVKLCDSEDADTRATSVFLLGCSAEATVIEKIKELANDPCWYVREQVLWALYNMHKNKQDVSIDDMKIFSEDPDERVRESWTLVNDSINRRTPTSGKDSQPIIVQRLVKSVRANGFENRYKTSIFEC